MILFQTATAIATFVLAMLKYPEIQKRAQAELDDILHGGLPTLDDQEVLPYVTAVVYETLRWKPVTPFGRYSRLNVQSRHNMELVFRAVRTEVGCRSREACLSRHSARQHWVGGQLCRSMEATEKSGPFP